MGMAPMAPAPPVSPTMLEGLLVLVLLMPCALSSADVVEALLAPAPLLIFPPAVSLWLLSVENMRDGMDCCLSKSLVLVRWCWFCRLLAVDWDAASS